MKSWILESEIAGEAQREAERALVFIDEVLANKELLKDFGFSNRDEVKRCMSVLVVSARVHPDLGEDYPEKMEQYRKDKQNDPVRALEYAVEQRKQTVVLIENRVCELLFKGEIREAVAVSEESEYQTVFVSQDASELEETFVKFIKTQKEGACCDGHCIGAIPGGVLFSFTQEDYLDFSSGATRKEFLS